MPDIDIKEPTHKRRPLDWTYVLHSNVSLALFRYLINLTYIKAEERLFIPKSAGVFVIVRKCTDKMVVMVKLYTSVVAWNGNGCKG